MDILGLVCTIETKKSPQEREVHKQTLKEVKKAHSPKMVMQITRRWSVDRIRIIPRLEKRKEKVNQCVSVGVSDFDIIITVEMSASIASQASPSNKLWHEQSNVVLEKPVEKRYHWHERHAGKQLCSEPTPVWWERLRRRLFASY